MAFQASLVTAERVRVPHVVQKLVMETLKYICDRHRHLVCLPFSIENLHTMARELNLKECHFHFHKGKNPHYDIPKRRIRNITKLCHEIVSSRRIWQIINEKENVMFKDENDSKSNSFHEIE